MTCWRVDGRRRREVVRLSVQKWVSFVGAPVRGLTSAGRRGRCTAGLVRPFRYFRRRALFLLVLFHVAGFVHVLDCVWLFVGGQRQATTLGAFFRSSRRRFPGRLLARVMLRARSIIRGEVHHCPARKINVLVRRLACICQQVHIPAWST